MTSLFRSVFVVFSFIFRTFGSGKCVSSHFVELLNINKTFLTMVDFSYHAPTEVVFGKDSEHHVAALVKKYGGTRLLLHYGGKSAERSGLLDVVRGQLRQAGIAFVELGGVVPNPLLSKVYEGIDLCRSEGVDFILAVGGGSVIDSAKAISFRTALRW